MAEQKQETGTKAPEAKTPEAKTPEAKKDDFKHFIRVSSADLNGNYKLERALTKIKGVGFQFANAICVTLKIDPNQKTGYLDAEHIKRIEELLKDPTKYNLPTWLFNRQRDYETGEDGHLLTADLDFTKANDIKRMKMIKCYKGTRHAKGLPVRGQKTKSNFRRNKGKGSLGVKRKKGAKSGKT
jgi:small subunit ribosomal protein S13|tara:strand:- start:1289 stop:1840 length:552 start_codon:yes stop_codon:yes gene_type:complete